MTLEANCRNEAYLLEERVADDYVASRPRIGPLILQRLSDYSNHSTNGTSIVDVGCGPGWLLSELISRNLNVIGIEKSAAMRAHARTNLGGREVQIFPSIQEYSESGVYSPLHTLVFSQSLHLIGHEELISLFRQQAPLATTLALWIDRKPNSVYDTAVHSLYGALGITRSRTNSFYNDLNAKVLRYDLKPVERWTETIVRKYDLNGVKSYLFSQTHVHRTIGCNGFDQLASLVHQFFPDIQFDLEFLSTAIVFKKIPE